MHNNLFHKRETTSNAILRVGRLTVYRYTSLTPRDKFFLFFFCSDRRARELSAVFSSEPGELQAFEAAVLRVQ